MLRPSGATSSEIHDPRLVSNAMVRVGFERQILLLLSSAGSFCFPARRTPVRQDAHKPSNQT